LSPVSSRPIIGVPACRRMLDPHPFHMVGEKYLQALVVGADALPVMIPALTDGMDVDAVLSQLDGVLLTGSPSNVEPHHYDGEASEPGTLHDAHRDALTLPLAKRALETGVPLLAVCRGFQELNVVLGGTLHQDLAGVEGYHDWTCSTVHRMHSASWKAGSCTVCLASRRRWSIPCTSRECANWQMV